MYLIPKDKIEEVEIYSRSKTSKQEIPGNLKQGMFTIKGILPERSSHHRFL